MKCESYKMFIYNICVHITNEKERGKVMTISEKVGLMGLVPVVVFDSMEYVLPTAKAMIDGGLPIMEITLRTKHGLPAIKKINEEYPEILLGAGTVLKLEQAKAAVEAGAKFIVSPGFNDEIVSWCLKNDIMITPGCVTPTEIEHALSFGVDILKFFPANVYGGINGCKALHGPYRMVKFVPTGGVSLNNLSDFADKEYVHAIGGGWLCSGADMKSGNYLNISKTVKESIDMLLGFEVRHVGINAKDDSEALSVANQLDGIFGFGIKEGNGSNFVGKGFEIMKGQGIGENGHVAVATNNVDRAMYYLSKIGYKFDTSPLKEKNDKNIAMYLENTVGGFGIHLLQK